MPETARNLCLHYVTGAGEPPRRLALRTEDLRALIEREHAAGRTHAPLAAYATERAPDSTRFTLSFDDAHRSLLAHALPLLRALDLRPTVFVPTGYVGTSDEFLTWDELRLLRDAGWTLGSHTVTHPRMGQRRYDEDDRAHAARLLDECARSRETLFRELGLEPALFAYPYGEAPDPAREAARRAGYTHAFTVRDALEWDGDPLAIPRVDGMEAHGYIAPAYDEPTRFSVVVPACDRVEILTEVVRRLGAQSYPRERYEVVVVDDGSRDDLRPALRDAPDNVRLVTHSREPGTFRAGQARQRGADAARFDTLAFLDADVAVSRDFLWHLDWIHRRAPGAVVLGYLSGYNLHDMGQLHTVDAVRPLEDLDGAVNLLPDRSREPALRACLDNLDWLEEPWRLAYTGNLSLPRALLTEVGGFARAFEGWGLEDLDLGLRLSQAGARWVFSRFAVGYHLVDPREDSARNPFRRPNPTRGDFDRYLVNLETLRRLHPDSPAVTAFCAQTLRDIDETCGRPHTVGLEMGGADSSLALPFHRALNRVQPGGLDTYELLDRLAYARKVGARAVYILGGEPAEHPGFLRLVREARAGGMERVTAETHALPFARQGLAEQARDAGLDHAVVKVCALEREPFERVARRAGTFEKFRAGLDALGRAGIFRTARVLASEETLGALGRTLEGLAREGLRVDEIVATRPEHRTVVETIAREHGLAHAVTALPS